MTHTMRERAHASDTVGTSVEIKKLAGGAAAALLVAALLVILNPANENMPGGPNDDDPFWRKFFNPDWFKPG